MVVIVEPKLEARRSVEERHGFVAALRALGGMGGHVSAPMSLGTRRSVEERHGFAGVLRALGGMGGHVGAPHVPRSGDRVTASPLSAALRKISPAVVKGLAACARSVTATTRGVGKLVR
jgi:hypothetical protein